MKLHEHPDFEQAVLNAAEHFRVQGLRAAIIEKDYLGAPIISSTRHDLAGRARLHPVSWSNQARPAVASRPSCGSCSPIWRSS